MMAFVVREGAPQLVGIEGPVGGCSFTYTGRAPERIASGP
jgi:hypothetical protein